MYSKNDESPREICVEKLCSREIDKIVIAGQEVPPILLQ
jgi:hypothetical protein